MVHLRHLLAVFGSLLLCAGCTPEPCTSCLSVAGTYTEIAPQETVPCDDGSFLSLTAAHVPDTEMVTQSVIGDGPANSSALFVGDSLVGMAGVLHADLSASFGPIPAVAQPVDSAGSPTAGQPEPGKLYLEGWFAPVGEGMQFKGTYVFIATGNGCEVDAPATWQR